MRLQRLTKAQAATVEDMIRMCNLDNRRAAIGKKLRIREWYEPGEKYWCELNGKRVAERIGRSNRWRRLFTVRR